jgi:hypothetical protein
VIKQLMLKVLLFCLPAFCLADSVPRTAGKVVGEFGAGVGEAIGTSVAKGVAVQQPQWITVHPKSKEECLKESGGTINPVFVRCRNGRQEFVRLDANGNKAVLNERPIPMH